MSNSQVLNTIIEPSTTSRSDATDHDEAVESKSEETSIVPVRIDNKSNHNLIGYFDPVSIDISPNYIKDKTKSNNNKDSFILKQLNRLLLVDPDWYESDTHLCDSIKGFPIYWPKLYTMILIFTNVIRLVNEILDMQLFIQTIEYNDKFFNFEDGAPESQFELLSPLTVNSNVTARFVFTFVPSFFATVVLFVYMNKVASGESSERGVILYVCFVFTVFIMAFIYKIILSLIILYQLYQIIIKLWFIDIIYFKKASKISNISQVLHEIDSNKTFTIIFLMESMFSTWPLWIITLLELQNNDNGNVFNNSKTGATYTALMLKSVFGALSILSEMKKISVWRYCTTNRKIITLQCGNHNNNNNNKKLANYNKTAMRLYSIKQIEYGLTHWVAQNVGSGNSNTNIECDICGLDKFNSNEYIFHCNVIECDEYICIKCFSNIIYKFEEYQDSRIHSIYNILDHDRYKYRYNYNLPNQINVTNYDYELNNNSDMVFGYHDCLKFCTIDNMKSCKFWIKVFLFLILLILLPILFILMFRAFIIVWIDNYWDNIKNGENKDINFINVLLFIVIAMFSYILLIVCLFVQYIGLKMHFKNNSTKKTLLQYCRTGISWIFNVFLISCVFGIFLCMSMNFNSNNATKFGEIGTDAQVYYTIISVFAWCFAFVIFFVACIFGVAFCGGIHGSCNCK